MIMPHFSSSSQLLTVEDVHLISSALPPHPRPPASSSGSTWTLCSERRHSRIPKLWKQVSTATHIHIVAQNGNSRICPVIYGSECHKHKSLQSHIPHYNPYLCYLVGSEKEVKVIWFCCVHALWCALVHVCAYMYVLMCGGHWACSDLFWTVFSGFQF